MGIGIGGGTGGACAAGHTSHNHIDNTLISFDGGIWQDGDVRTGTLTNQNAACSAAGGSGSGSASGLMNLQAMQNSFYNPHYIVLM